MTHQERPLADVVPNEGNRIRGHIALAADGHTVAALTDQGNKTLHVWTVDFFELGVTGARNLAAALNDWADRRET
ncbi:MAG TPA: hypothetical protein VIP77_04815 [Jiangellaceae bacterium]